MIDPLPCPVDAENDGCNAEPPAPEPENALPIAPPFHLSRQQRRALARKIAESALIEEFGLIPRRLRRRLARDLSKS